MIALLTFAVAMTVTAQKDSPAPQSRLMLPTGEQRTVSDEEIAGTLAVVSVHWSLP